MHSVFRVEIRAHFGSEVRVRIADMIFKDRKPFVVIAWEGLDGERAPGVVEGLNPANLKKVSVLEPHYRYDGIVEGLDWNG